MESDLDAVQQDLVGLIAVHQAKVWAASLQPLDCSTSRCRVKRLRDRSAPLDKRKLASLVAARRCIATMPRSPAVWISSARRSASTRLRPSDHPCPGEWIASDWPVCPTSETSAPGGRAQLRPALCLVCVGWDRAGEDDPDRLASWSRVGQLNFTQVAEERAREPGCPVAARHQSQRRTAPWLARLIQATPTLS
jgi:hypothetical protein